MCNFSRNQDAMCKCDMCNFSRNQDATIKSLSSILQWSLMLLIGDIVIANFIPTKLPHQLLDIHPKYSTMVENSCLWKKRSTKSTAFRSIFCAFWRGGADGYLKILWLNPFSNSLSDLFLSQAVQSHLTASSASHPSWASRKSKLMSGPVTSWPERPRPRRGSAGPAPDVHPPEGTESHTSLFYWLYTLYYWSLLQTSSR